MVNPHWPKALPAKQGHLERGGKDELRKEKVVLAIGALNVSVLRLAFCGRAFRLNFY